MNEYVLIDFKFENETITMPVPDHFFVDIPDKAYKNPELFKGTAWVRRYKNKPWQCVCAEVKDIISILPENTTLIRDSSPDRPLSYVKSVGVYQGDETLFISDVRIEDTSMIAERKTWQAKVKEAVSAAYSSIKALK